MLNRLEGNLSDQRPLSLEESEPNTDVLVSEQNMLPDLWEICAKDDANLLQVALKTFSSGELLFKAITSINSYNQTLLHSLAQRNAIMLIQIIIQTLPIDKRTLALNSRDDDCNTVAYKLIACSDGEKVDSLLEFLFNLYPAQDRFEALTIKNHYDMSILSLLFDREEEFHQLQKIYNTFYKIFLVNCGNAESTRNFLSTFDNWKIANKIDYFTHFNYIEFYSLKLAFEYYDNFNNSNIELMVRWYFVEGEKFQIPIIQQKIIQQKINCEKIESILNSFIDKPLCTIINNVDLRQKYPEIASSIQMSWLAISDIQEFKNIFRAYQTCIKKLNQFLHKCSDLDEDLQITQDQINKCKMQFHMMNLQIFDSLKLSLNSRYAVNPFYIEIKDLYFDISILCMQVTTDNFKAIYTRIENKLEQQKLNLLTRVEKKPAVESTSITTNSNENKSSSLPGKVVKNNLNKNELNNLDDLTSEQVHAFEKIYQLFYFNENSIFVNTFNIFLNNSFHPLTSKEKLKEIRNSSSPMVAKAIELALAHAGNCNSQNKELVLQLYKFMDSQFSSFMVSPFKIDTIVKFLDVKPKEAGQQKKSDLIRQHAELICHIKMATFAKSDRILDKAIFTARNQVLDKFANDYNHDVELRHKFNSLDLFICKMLEAYASYDAKKNKNRMMNKELLYEALRLAYQLIIDTKQLDVDTLTKIEVELTSKCIQIKLDVAQDHQRNNLLSRFVTQSSFDKTLGNELEEVSDNNSTSKTHVVTRFANKLKLFGKHEAVPLPEHILNENNITSSRDDLTEFKDLINQLILAIPKKWQLHLNKLMEKASKANEQEIKIEPGKRILREMALKDLGYFIKQTNSALENKTINFQGAIKELQQYLLQVIASSKQESIKSELASSLTTFINNKIKPKIKHESMYSDKPKHETVSSHMSPFSL